MAAITKIATTPTTAYFRDLPFDAGIAAALGTPDELAGDTLVADTALGERPES